MQRFPFPAFPNSWFQLAWSDEVRQEEGRNINAFGIELVALRERSGEPKVWDAQDPDKRPWPVCERNEMIFVYHHADRKLPAFEVPEVSEVSSRAWIPIGRLEWIIKSHVQEFVENAVDLGHFRYLHRCREHARLIRFNMLDHTFSATLAGRKSVFGTSCPFELTISYDGMGLAVGHLTQPMMLTTIVTGLPIDGTLIRQRFTLYARIP